ncbi:hypothetical protein [Spongiimicrobium sp. 2-473A-2-J]|uniref:hypothetical protein n=1 Tax=Eudoraea algarum TaxID=3417568 RepID=UPI003D36CC93
MLHNIQNKMNKTVIGILLIFQIPIFMVGQHDDTFEIQGDKIDSTSNSEIQLFADKFNLWLKSSNTDTLYTDLLPERMVNNFVLFSEDGLMMKDLKFHSIESCKKEIISNLPSLKNKDGENYWIYVTMESQINKTQLIEILKFLRENKIDYQFGQEDEFISKMIKNE